MPTNRVGAPVFFLTLEHEWVLGKVTAYDPHTKTYSCSSTDPVFVTVDSVPYDPKRLWLPQPEALSEDVDDLLNLTELHEASLLFCLRMRYLRDVVYTNIGPIVVALNPFNYSIPWYAEPKMENYLVEDVIIEKNLPHSWATAHNTYWEMRENGLNQTILISGESGAGKTESAKIVLRYLGALSRKNGTPQDRESYLQVNKRVLAASPILESFGNAKTVKNDNSSRFGKFSKVQFDKNGLLVGCHVTKYLLEKSRIIMAAAGERVYHSYYQLAQGPLANEFSLRNPKVYRVLNAGGCIHIDGVDDAKEYLVTKQAMNDVGITEEEQMSIWRIVAGVLFLQNTDFIETEECAGRVAKIDSNLLPVLARACELWDINDKEFKKELVSTYIMTQREETVKYFNKVKALDTRDSVCKSLYDWLFDWLVVKINQTTNRDAVTTQWIGLLDIFGFEDFQKNSFEQLCINLANEVLQGHYNQHIFALDMRECQEEGIDTTQVPFADNKECIDLLMGKVGVFTLLDEECAVSGNEANYLQKLVEKFGPAKSKGGNAYFVQAAGRGSDNQFIVRHYASDVRYSVDGFLDKNRDALKETMKRIFSRSGVGLIPIILPKEESKLSSKGTVGSYFIRQLVELMSVIHSTNPHWIRCIKPNVSRQPRQFSNSLVMQQLRSSGVLETIKIRKSGYPIRFSFTELAQRYRVLCGNGLHGREACQQILHNSQISTLQAQLGKMKVFMKHEAFSKLNHARERSILCFSSVLQAVGRGSLARAALFHEYAVVHRQRIMEERRIRQRELKRQQELEENRKMAAEAKRKHRDLLLKERQYRAAVRIQKLVRGGLTRKRFLTMYLSILRAREEHVRDDELQKYRVYEMNANRKIRSLETRLSEKNGGKEGFVAPHRREMLRERREQTMRFIHESQLLHDVHLKEAASHEKARRAKEAAERKSHIQNMGKYASQEKQHKISVLQQDVERRFVDEMLTELGGCVVDTGRNHQEYRNPNNAQRCCPDSVFSTVRQRWEQKERWVDERERLLDPFLGSHGSHLTAQQRRLEGNYRVQTISKAMWKSDAEKIILSYRQQWGSHRDESRKVD
ncbi:putative myosin heavy chain MYA2-related [Trypanosoma grayi]|uniref:putative myosin heavy chain MYA2-related n=1 Tax=Trypanosoma grayi TaxID=71804 RepID=UPI0004F42D54|nr:putative myosin heavy chain MYA2-related [Trypanosoma grayi]KEG13737.1 putative myosin heavy chain MYA2-related [Trypanosoma grayi]